MRTAFLEDSDDEDWFELGEVDGGGEGSRHVNGTAGYDGSAKMGPKEEPIDAEEIYGASMPLVQGLRLITLSDLIRSVTDPEHPLTSVLAVASRACDD